VREASLPPCMRPSFACLYLLCAAFAPLTALAQSEERVLADAVSVTSVDPCMPSEPLIARITHWRTHDRLDARISVRVFDRAEQLSFEILFQGRSVADRTFDVLPRDCAARRDAIALAVSLAIDNVVQRREEIAAQIAAEPAATPPSTPPAAPTDAPTTDDVPALEPQAPRRALELGLVLGGAAAVHVLPGVAALGEAAVELSVGQFMARAGLMGSSVGGVALSDGRLRTDLLGGRTDLCLVQPISSVSVIGCMGMSAGTVRMVGSRYTQSSSSAQLWVASSARVALEWPRDVLRGRLWLEGIVPLLAPGARVVDENGATLSTATTVRVGVILGLEALIVIR